MKVNIHFKDNESLGMCENCDNCKVVQMAGERYVRCDMIGPIKKTVERCDMFEIKGHMSIYDMAQLAWVPVLDKKTRAIKRFRPPYEEE